MFTAQSANSSGTFERPSNVGMTIRKKLDAVIREEKKKGIEVKEFYKEGKPAEEILKVVKDEKIDLLIMIGHEESKLEHFLFGRINDTIFRRMPCSIMMVKKEPEPA